MPRSIEERNDFPTTILFLRYMFQVLLGKYWDFFFPKQWLIDEFINLNCFGHLQRSCAVAMKFTIFDYLRCTSTTKEYMYPICGIARYSWLFRDMSQLDLKKNTPSQLHKKYRNTKCYTYVETQGASLTKLKYLFAMALNSWVHRFLGTPLFSPISPNKDLVIKVACAHRHLSSLHGALRRSPNNFKTASFRTAAEAVRYSFFCGNEVCCVM